MGHNHEYRYAIAKRGKGVRRDTKNVMVNVARAVCRTFNGRPRKGQQVDHIDSNPSNNDFRNLRWVSRKENNTRPHAMEQRA